MLLLGGLLNRAMGLFLLKVLILFLKEMEMEKREVAL